MSEMLKMLHAQLLEYSKELKEVEKEIVRKYRAKEDYSEDVRKATGLKLLQQECVKMMAKQKLSKSLKNE